ncbi:hypothetical protein CHUAL_002030 [Chamberlinius hualienensis]
MASLMPLLLLICVSHCHASHVYDVIGRMYSDIFRWNPANRVLFSFQVTLPLSTFLPKWKEDKEARNFKSSYIQQSFFHRSKSPLLTCPSQRVELEDYLAILDIKEGACQERFICDVASTPDKYQPLSQILLPKLNYNIEELNRKSNYHDIYNTTTYYLQRAVNIAKNPNKYCHIEYRGCPKGADEMINMWIIWGWRLLSHYFNIKFITETNM